MFMVPSLVPHHPLPLWRPFTLPVDLVHRSLASEADWFVGVPRAQVLHLLLQGIDSEVAHKWVVAGVVDRPVGTHHVVVAGLAVRDDVETIDGRYLADVHRERVDTAEGNVTLVSKSFDDFHVRTSLWIISSSLSPVTQAWAWSAVVHVAGTRRTKSLPV